MTQLSRDLTLNQLYLLYALMLHGRMFEERCSVLYAQKLIGGFCHLYSGQEAIAIGINHVLSSEDNVITAYRCHVHSILSRMRYSDFIPEHASGISTGDVLKNESLARNDGRKVEVNDQSDCFLSVQKYIDDNSQANATLAELMGRQTGSSKGKGGSMHLYDGEYNYYGGHGIVGIQIPLGTGLAFADKYKGVKAVTFASLGDGAMNQGQVYEAFNMAVVWKLPVIFVLENNGFAIGTAVHRVNSDMAFYKRAEGFGIKSFYVDGMNVFDVIRVAKEAKEYALENGPVFIEFDTYRYRPHSMSDPATYRSKDDVNRVKETRDPIELIKRVICKMESKKDYVQKMDEGRELDVKDQTRDSVKQMDQMMQGKSDDVVNFGKWEEYERKRIDQIVEYASQSPLPGEEELMMDIFAD